MNPAKASRLAKEKHPERYCPDPRCLWRVQHANTLYPYLDDTPCPKHMKATTPTPFVIGDKVRRMDEPHVLLRVRELDTEGTIDGTAKALCSNSFGHGKWMLLSDLEAAL